MTVILDRKGSVTAHDMQQTANPGGVWLWQVLDPAAGTSPVPTLPPYGSRARSYMLASTLDLEDMWASAVYKAVSTLAALNFTVKDSEDSDRRTEKAQSLLLDFNGPAEYTSAIASHLLDFLTTDNAAFVEIERESKSPSSRPKALWHLDTFGCYRTGNAKYPVSYQDLYGTFHLLRADQVLIFADMPSGRRGLYGLGRCAASRAFATITKLAAVETYFREKITGSRALALHFVAGVTPDQITDAIKLADAQQDQKGVVIYKGAITIPVFADQGVSVATVDLASVPDGFDVTEERKDAYLRYANAIGIPVQDLQPLSGQGLGTGTQSKVLDAVSKTQGIAYWRVLWERKINRLVLPKATTMEFGVNDLDEQKLEAETRKLRAETRKTQIESGELTAVQALNMAVDAGDAPAEFLQHDETAGSTLTDTGEQSKPVEVLPGVALPALPQPPAPQLPATKAAKRLTIADLDQAAALEAAQALVQEVAR
jgi:hypothetical protein